MRGDDGDASDTRRCFKAATLAGVGDEIGNGALNKNVDEEGTVVAARGADRPLFGGLLEAMAYDDWFPVNWQDSDKRRRPD